ncbi:ATP-binding protein [Phenylobacterium sp. J426]|uniref:ATP-binding protein n=1 Tax=Phenylobacterium sp. J426 TaxID=2898439 RepID=UPI0021519C15|nr:ATP-binding protein [Phenylobacterium sp. J426]MCR5876593.1 ATP-binding protein [Phenylobacterium sp. J426]
MLEALGINMYTTLGKCLVEFVANAYDSEAHNVTITIPHEDIEAARTKVRQAAKAEVAAGLRDRFTVLLDTLPNDLKVVIEDDGHGMSWKDVESKFLPLNRKRREGADGTESNIKSETGKRFVMGRKGLGKLAGFGAAENVEVRTKRQGETFATIITLQDSKLKGAANVTDVDIPATYEEGLDPKEQGTRITLSGLKSDAVKERLETLEETIREAFQALRPEDFLVTLNETPLVPQPPEYEFIYPAGGLDERGYASSILTIEDIGDVPLKYFVGFRPRGQHLPARKRGARIYCNNRLAAGPSLFKLPTGMHNFHATDYLECVVEADEFDRAGIDLINTNRTQLREDNEAVRALLEHVSQLMKAAIASHSLFRDKQTSEKLKTDPTAQVLSRIIDTLPRKTRKPAGKLLHALANEHGVDSPAFQELAPAFINSVNATEVLVKLIEARTRPETIEKVAEHLRELSEIERIDVLKLYRGRRDGSRRSKSSGRRARTSGARGVLSASCTTCWKRTRG